MNGRQGLALLLNLSVPASKGTVCLSAKAQKGRHMVNTKRKKYCTMIVEDDPMAARHLEMVLDKMEEIFISYVIENALMAEAYCCREHIDLILMDVQMPEMNGLEATRAIRALSRPDAKSVPILAMTANAFKEDEKAALDAGMNDFIPKPIDVKTMYQKLYRALHSSCES